VFEDNVNYVKKTFNIRSCCGNAIHSRCFFSLLSQKKQTVFYRNSWCSSPEDFIVICPLCKKIG
jgi:hypothetical protein